MVLKATYKLSDVKIDTPVNISNFMLAPVPERPNDTYLRFEFTHHPKTDPYEESEKEIQLFSLVFSVLYGIRYPEFENIVDRSGRTVGGVADHNVRIPIELKQEDFNKIERTYEKVKSMAPEEKNIFEFVARWIQKSKRLI